MFKHFLITRFNLRNPKWISDKKNVAVLTDEWHENRFKLFDEFCFKSVSAQTNTNFEWLVFFDKTTPQKFIDHVEELKSKMTNFIPLYVDGMDKFLPSILDYVSQCEEDYIITSRLDNDDAISKDYIKEVQKRFDKQDFRALDFIDGYSLQIKPEVRIGKRIDQYNPFISLIEKNDNPKTVWSVRKHSHWKRIENVTSIRNVKVWTAIAHMENKVNGFGGYGQIDLDQYFDNFKIARGEESYIRQHLVANSNWNAFSLRMRFKSVINYHYKNFKKAIGLYKLKKN